MSAYALDPTVDFRGKEYAIPEHTLHTLENYLLHGLPPGGFVTALLSNDLFRTVSMADAVNRENLYGIVRWVMDHAPLNSWGTAERIANWCKSDCEERLAFKDAVEKERIWDRLST